MPTRIDSHYDTYTRYIIAEALGLIPCTDTRLLITRDTTCAMRIACARNCVTYRVCKAARSVSWKSNGHPISTIVLSELKRLMAIKGYLAVINYARMRDRMCA